MGQGKLPGLVLGTEGVLDTDHVVLGDTVGDGNDEVQLGFNGLDDGVGGEGGRHVDN